MGGLVDLTPGYDTGHAEGVNDADQIVGWRNGRAFRLTGTTFTDLGVPTGYAQSFGFAVNQSGQVAGHVVTGSGNGEAIFRYTDGAGMVLIGGFGEHNRAFGINSAGSVVGEGLPVFGARQGFLYTDGAGMQGLNSLVDPAAGWFVLGAGGINDSGQIAGWASSTTGAQHAVRLDPGTGSDTPAAPSALQGSASRSRVRLGWTDNAGNETGFRIERSTGQSGYVLVAVVGSNVVRYTDTTVARNTTYYYRIQAYNNAKSSAWSNELRIRAA